ncbi:MAG: anhydro-N-acetylmuramic acid kinase, partial [Rickettsiales bacterium]|nr:anhydro-N-acetylmuramic acid kinase [Rickettsiales bacterium]
KSLQLGNAEFISKKLNKPVVYNFRDKDIFFGGEGAPLVPIFHKAIFATKKKKYSCC